MINRTQTYINLLMIIGGFLLLLLWEGALLQLLPYTEFVSKVREVTFGVFGPVGYLVPVGVYFTTMLMFQGISTGYFPEKKRFGIGLVVFLAMTAFLSLLSKSYQGTMHEAYHNGEAYAGIIGWALSGLAAKIMGRNFAIAFTLLIFLAGCYLVIISCMHIDGVPMGEYLKRSDDDWVVSLRRDIKRRPVHALIESMRLDLEDDE